jgi:hypothetical protein
MRPELWRMDSPRRGGKLCRPYRDSVPSPARSFPLYANNPGGGLARRDGAIRIGSRFHSGPSPLSRRVEHPRQGAGTVFSRRRTTHRIAHHFWTYDTVHLRTEDRGRIATLAREVKTRPSCLFRRNTSEVGFARRLWPSFVGHCLCVRRLCL